jgi:hypothetical protein
LALTPVRLLWDRRLAPAPCGKTTRRYLQKVKRLLDERIVRERASSLIILVLFLIFVGVIMVMSVPMA